MNSSKFRRIFLALLIVLVPIAGAATVLALRAPAQTDQILVAVGDIASCNSDGDEATAALLNREDLRTATIALLGDNAYDAGTPTEYRECYDPAWGQFKGRTRPSVGNHEYMTPDAEGYFGYFGNIAGDPTKGYYSYDLGNWHIVVLNSNCSKVGGCEAGSEQEQWLRADLAESQTQCTLAYWHNPRFSSGSHGSDKNMEPLWQALYENYTEVILNGHDHAYERFARQTPDGTANAVGGIRQFVVGTGGKSLYKIEEPIANSEIHNDETYGVLKLTLKAQGYDWEFVPVASGSFADSGSDTCY